MLKQLMRHRTYRYLLIGGSVYVLEMVTIIIAQGLGADAILSVGVSFGIGIVASFMLQKFVTFGDNRTQHKVLATQIIAFVLLVLFNFAFTLFMTGILAATIPATIARTLILGITTVWNFYLYKTRIFRADQSPLY